MYWKKLPRTLEWPLWTPKCLNGIETHRKGGSQELILGFTKEAELSKTKSYKEERNYFSAANGSGRPSSELEIFATSHPAQLYIHWVENISGKISLNTTNIMVNLVAVLCFRILWSIETKFRMILNWNTFGLIVFVALPLLHISCLTL